jgi:hypothetical protein
LDKEFEEFDIPKSKGTKGGKKSSKGDDLDIDDDFKDLGFFSEDSDGFEEEDDDY